MLGYIIRRLVAAVLVILVTSIAVFALFTYGPKDPVQAICPAPRCTAKIQDTVRESLGLDQPVLQQYTAYVKGVFVGRDIVKGGATISCDAPCLGYSFITNVNVWQFLKGRYPATVSIAVGGATLYLIIGVGVGVFAAKRRGTSLDKAAVASTLFISSVPYYVLALLAYLVLVNRFGLFPATDYYPITEGPLKWASGMLLVWLVLGFTNSTYYARFSRGSMVEALSEDFVRTAKAKGLHDRRVTYKHALRAAIAPVVTIFGLDFASLLVGTVFTERIFGINGIGVSALNAINQGDLPIVFATVLFASVLIILANLIVDLLYSVIDPRVRIS